MAILPTTGYFERVLAEKRPYMRREWCEEALSAPDHKTLQADGRIRYYKYIPEAARFIRVITLEDGKTLHNVFFDRNFKPTEQ